MSTVPLVEVLMSTHNGAKHLQPQIQSVLSQADVSVRLVVRDDGSTDDTVHLLRSINSTSLHVDAGRNLGLPNAYFSLIQDSTPDADLWALADQDDVWMPYKLSRAAAMLRRHEEPAMYCARVQVVDDELRPLYPHPLPRRGPSFANALVQNIATGCTIVFNGAARAALRDRWPKFAVMHDAWVYLVVSGIGTVIYDPTVVVAYRQHANNAVGMGTGSLSRTMRRIQRQLSVEGPGAHGRQNAQLKATHAPLLSSTARRQLNRVLEASEGSLSERVRYALTGPVHRQTVGSDLVLRALIVAGRL